MAHIFDSVLETIGYTPLVRLHRVEEAYGCRARLLAKVERGNPGGSVKDRAALRMVEDAEQKGILKAGSTIIEPTSGNTGIGLCVVAAARGYRAVIIMPDSMSVERINLMRAYGAEVILTPGALGMQGAVEKAEELQAATPGSIIAGQFVNPSNSAAHYDTTGPELWRDTDGVLDAFVAGIGTGGTITGVGHYLKKQNHAIRIIGVEPSDSPLLSGGKAGPHGLQGIGANFVPAVLDQKVCDEMITVTTPAAYELARFSAYREGLLVGISSGAALWAAVQVACRPEYEGKTVVALLPDSGERYLSTNLFSE